MKRDKMSDFFRSITLSNSWWKLYSSCVRRDDRGDQNKSDDACNTGRYAAYNKHVRDLKSRSRTSCVRVWYA